MSKVRFPEKRFQFNGDPFNFGLKILPIRRNPNNGFYVLTAHYSQHPKATNDDGSINEEWYKKERGAVSQAIWDREMEIKYNSMGGELVWAAYDAEKHVIPACRLDERWLRFRFIDYGHRNPTCCLWIAVDFDGVGYVYREWYHPTFADMQRGNAAHKQRYTLKQHAQIINVLSGVEQYTGTYIDPQAGEVNFANSTDKKTILVKLAEYGLVCSKAKKSGEGIDSIDNAFREGKLYIFDTCVNTLREIEQYRFAEFTEKMQETRNLKESPVKRNDHACNALKYWGNHRLKMTPIPQVIRAIPSKLVRVIRPDSETATADIKRAKERHKKRYALR